VYTGLPFVDRKGYGCGTVPLKYGCGTVPPGYGSQTVPLPCGRFGRGMAVALYPCPAVDLEGYGCGSVPRLVRDEALPCTARSVARLQSKRTA
jgi:hypothetical protein